MYGRPTTSMRIGFIEGELVRAVIRDRSTGTIVYGAEGELVVCSNRQLRLNDGAGSYLGEGFYYVKWKDRDGHYVVHEDDLILSKDVHEKV